MVAWLIVGAILLITFSVIVDFLEWLTTPKSQKYEGEIGDRNW